MPLDMEDWEHCLLPSTFLLEDYVCVRANFMYILLFALTSSVLSDLFWVQILSFFFFFLSVHFASVLFVSQKQVHKHYRDMALLIGRWNYF